MPVRTLRPDELAAAQQIFQTGLDTTRVRVSEGSQVPNLIGRVGATLRGNPPPSANAITVGNTSYFPRELSSAVDDIAWLVHELTHQWQYQHFGMIYLAQAIAAPTYVYANPNESKAAALVRLYGEGKNFASFNREQQGDIVRDYYYARVQNPDPSTALPVLSAWDPYLQEIRQPAKT
ncbi:MAG: DUF4157 domain-containing protein [Chloroflexota bacterium]|nr:DUF4157 domain-containing protein [Chloroflexota bacterium]